MRLLTFLLLSSLVLASCIKSYHCDYDPSVDATILWTGDLSYDGCDWIVRVDPSTSYHPQSLDTAFQHDGLKVKIIFSKTGQHFICGFNPQGPEIIQIKSITK